MAFINLTNNEKPNVIPSSNISTSAVSGNVNSSQSSIDDLNAQASSILNNVDSNLVELEKLLATAVNLKASDLHLNTDYRPYVRVDGKLEQLNFPILNKEQIENFVKQLLQSRKEVNLSELFEYDMTFEAINRRFRVNIFREMGHFSIVLRLIPESILSLDDLDLPVVLKELINFANGLVLVTGPTGSGKSTTIASLLNLINLTQKKHIVTLEDPIEFVFPKGQGLVDQREFSIDFKNWDDALKSVLRQDPDVVMIGEMRDLETIESAIQIAETGHLVFATLHTNSASQSIDRIIDIFPSEKQSQIKLQLSNVIRAIVSQRLVPITGGGRKAACEILIATPAVKNSIRENTASQIDNLIQTGSDVGMISMERALVRLVEEGLISEETAKSFSIKPAEIDTLLSKRLF